MYDYSIENSSVIDILEQRSYITGGKTRKREGEGRGKGKELKSEVGGRR